MTKFRKTLSVLAAAVAFGTLAAGCHAQATQDPHESAADKAFGARVHAYLVRHPEVLQEMLDRMQAKQEADKQALAKGAIAGHRQALEHDPRDGVLGNPAGKVTVVEFFDYRCPFCKAAEPDVEKLLADNPDVRLVLKEFPIIDYEDQSHLSRDAARIALATMAQGKYAAAHKALLEQKAQLDPAVVDATLKAAGVDVAKARAGAEAKSIDDQLTDTLKLAHEIGVDGTPGFIVGDTLIAGARMDDLRTAIVAARKAPHG